MYPPRQFKISGGCMKPKNDSLLKALSVEAANSFGKAPDRDGRVIIAAARIPPDHETPPI